MRISKTVPHPLVRMRHGKWVDTARKMVIGDSVLVESVPQAIGLAVALRRLNKTNTYRKLKDGRIRVWVIAEKEGGK